MQEANLAKKADDWMDAESGLRRNPSRETMASLHKVNEHFFAKFNDTRASRVIFLSFLSSPRFAPSLT